MPRSFMRRTLVLGDFTLLMAAVPVTLAVRELATPTLPLVVLHLLPFSLLGLVFIAVFFSAGMYDPVTSIVRRELPNTILGAQIINMAIAGLFFFFVPVFGITPKTNLFIYLMVSVVFVSLWHLFLPAIARGGKARAVLIGDSKEIDEVVAESKSGLCPFQVARVVSVSGTSDAELAKAVSDALKEAPPFLIADTDDDRLQSAFAVWAREGRSTALIDFADVYEELFRKVPLSGLSHRSFSIEKNPKRILYSIVKRAFDIFFGVLLSAILAVLIPFVWTAVRLEGPGPLFIRQQRMGRGGSTISVLKFRSMRLNKTASEEWTVEEKNDNPVTKVGAFLRKTSLDELPQALAILAGDLSLIGPRSDISGLAERLAQSIPFYSLRYRVTPGISGWAQVNQRYSPGNISPQSLEESRVRLAYDLYYSKHRSPLLDLSITLRTLKTLISRWFS